MTIWCFSCYCNACVLQLRVVGVIMKTALIQTRVEPDLKAEVEKILREIGISTSEAITIFLNRVKLEKGIPFELKIPNARTLEAMKDVEEGRVEKFKSSRAMFESMMDDAENS